MTTINMQMVADLDNIEVYKIKGNEYFFACPVCGKKDEKCSFNPTKGKEYGGIPSGLWSCFHCGEGGNAVDLHARLNGWSYREALDDLLGNEHIASRPMMKMSFAPAKTVETKRTDDVTVDKVYRDLLSISPLSEGHKADLLRRGFTEKMINLFGFKDAPTNGMKTVRDLNAMGDIVKGVPGFYDNSFAFTIAGVKKAGYLCPVYHPHEVSRDELFKKFATDKNLLCVKRGDGRYFTYRIVGFQKRVDHPDDGNKYVWLSSSDRKDGVSSGSPSTCLIGTTSHVVVITEGILKATVTYSLLNGKYTVIGVPGVKSLVGFKKLLRGGFITKDDLVFEAFDMDKAPMTDSAFMKAFDSREERHRSMSLDAYRIHMKEKQENIKSAADALCELVTSSTGAKIIPVKWDDTADKKWYGNFKGIDDMLLNDGAVEGFHKYIAKKQKLYAESVTEKTATMAAAR